MDVALKTCLSCGAQTNKVVKGMCLPHYMATQGKKTRESKCSMNDCQGGVRARMLCATHYGKLRAYEKAKHRLSLQEQNTVKLDKEVDINEH